MLFMLFAVLSFVIMPFKIDTPLCKPIAAVCTVRDIGTIRGNAHLIISCLAVHIAANLCPVPPIVV